MDTLNDKVRDFVKAHAQKYILGLVRVQAQVLLTKQLHGLVSKEHVVLQVVHDDMLRCAVVIMHATLEDYLRHVATLYMMDCGERILNTVPLIGSGDYLRPDKFFLGKLLLHRGRTVDDVLRESIEAHFQHRTFNDTTEIAGLLTTLGLHTDELRQYYSDLDAMIRRRHQIVHNVDLTEENLGSFEGHNLGRRVVPIDSDMVMAWHHALKRFLGRITVMCAKREFGEDIFSRIPADIFQMASE